MGSMLTGIASRSNDTAKVHRLYRDGHANELQFKEAVDIDEKSLVSAQKGFAYLSGGQLDWLDIMRPLPKCFTGFATRPSEGEDAIGPVTRWFRTNTFYRKPLINGKIDCNGDELAKRMPSGKKSVIFMLAPYSFAKLVENFFYEKIEALAMDYAVAIAKSSKKLKERGYSCLLLLEPVVGYEISLDMFKEPSWYSKAVSAAKSGDLKVGINFPIAEASKVVPLASKTDVDFIGIDAVFTSDFNINTQKDMLLGVVDGSRAGVESKESIGKKVQSFLDSAKFSGNYYVGPNDRLYDVPFEIAIKKINSLSSFTGV